MSSLQQHMLLEFSDITALAEEIVSPYVLSLPEMIFVQEFTKEILLVFVKPVSCAPGH